MKLGFLSCFLLFPMVIFAMDKGEAKDKLRQVEHRVEQIGGLQKKVKEVAEKKDQPDWESICLSYVEEMLTLNGESKSLSREVMKGVDPGTFKLKKSWQKKAYAQAEEQYDKCSTRKKRLVQTKNTLSAIKDIKDLKKEADDFFQKAKDLVIVPDLYDPSSLDEQYGTKIHLAEKGISSINSAIVIGKNHDLNVSEYLKKERDFLRSVQASWRQEWKQKKESLPSQQKAFEEKVYASKAEADRLMEQGLEEEAGFIYSRLMLALNGVSDAAQDKFGKIQEEILLSLQVEEIEKLSMEVFSEEELREEFFAHTLPVSLPSAKGMQLLDGGVENAGHILLYKDQYYRLLKRGTSPPKSLTVSVYLEGKLIDKDFLALPSSSYLLWNKYVLEDGLLFTPHTRLEAFYGLSLRIKVPSFDKNSLIIFHKGSSVDYQFVFSFDEDPPAYMVGFSKPPPWQLSSLEKPRIFTPEPFVESEVLPADRPVEGTPSLKKEPFADKLVQELKKDPLALCHFVQNEVETVEPKVREVLSFLYSTPVHRSVSRTLLERQGSAFEQCQLLVYLLRSAGYRASYILPFSSTLPKSQLEGVLKRKICSTMEQIRMSFPGVLLEVEGEKHTIFPWLKKTQVMEGYHVYSLLPEEYASADRWIQRYLQGDEEILKHVGADGNDMAAILFSKFVKEHLQKRGYTAEDVGLHVRTIKKQYSSFEDFPKPDDLEIGHIVNELPSKDFARVTLTFSSEQTGTLKQVAFPLADVGCGYGRIEPLEILDGKQKIKVNLPSQEAFTLSLDENVHTIDINILYNTFAGPVGEEEKKQLKLSSNAQAAICFHFGGEGVGISSLLQKEHSQEEGLFPLLGFVGSSYFEACSRGDKDLAILHKVGLQKSFSTGLAKLVPGEKGQSPQVDMFSFSSTLAGEVEQNRQYAALSHVNDSSGEHQVLYQVFGDRDAISTVRLLQIAHEKHVSNGKEGAGYLTVTPSILEDIRKHPEAAEVFYFSQFSRVGLSHIIQQLGYSWTQLNNLLSYQPGDLSSLYAYVTPGFVEGESGCQEMAMLIFGEKAHLALISNNNLWLNGGMARPISVEELTTSPAPWFFPTTSIEPALPDYGSHWIDLGIQIHSEESEKNVPWEERVSLGLEQKIKPKEPIFYHGDDCRFAHKPRLQFVADPVDVVSGAFFIDEADLEIQGGLPLQIRRNYSSKNTSLGLLGHGWKINLNPYLYEEEGKRYVTEVDGTTLVYVYETKTSRWIVLPEENKGVIPLEGGSNPFLQYMEGDVLYEPGGGYRVFKNGALHRWYNPVGQYLEFFYEGSLLMRIESSAGDYCGIGYTAEGLIAEVYVQDGRRVYYRYDSRHDLVQVTLASGASVLYEYDENHRVIKERSVSGHILENLYDKEGRVVEQYSPMGEKQQMMQTASFTYEEGRTKVRDALGGTSIYEFMQGLIYRVEDPNGNTIEQSWFLSANELLDGKTGLVEPYDGKGAYPRKLYKGKDRRGLEVTKLYDANGNLILETTTGEDLTGQGETSLTKQFVYNINNQCTEEFFLEQRVVATYDERFVHLPSCITEFVDGKSIRHTSYTYDDTGRVITEDRSGAKTHFIYNGRGLLSKEIVLTGTDDPDLETEFFYNFQGSCIQKVSGDRTEEMEYDLMGNLLTLTTYNSSRKLLNRKRYAYNASGEVIWEGSANEARGVFIEHHAGGMIKSRRVNTPTGYAYTLYEYDPRGYLIEEVDATGACTYLTYDAIGSMTSKTVAGVSTFFTYEAGGNLASVTKPLGGVTSYSYTSGGLLTKEERADGTSSEIRYDLYGRRVFESDNEIAFVTEYDDKELRQTRTHIETGEKESLEFDSRGNILKVIDRFGHVTEKTYDLVGRIKKKVTPGGRVTTWDYGRDYIITNRPSGERVVEWYEAGSITKVEVFAADDELIALTLKEYDPYEDKLTLEEGDKITRVWLSPWGSPLKVEEGETLTLYEYDKVGNCLAKEEGARTSFVYDKQQRLIEKHLPGGVCLTYTYDEESNLVESTLANGAVWSAEYDVMGRKLTERQTAQGQEEGAWSYSYTQGRVTKAIDPLGREHIYSYNAHGQLVEEKADRWRRVYTYDLSGQLLSAEQMQEEETSSWLSGLFFGEASDHSRIERSYDVDGNLLTEAIYLDGSLLYTVEQKHTENTRSVSVAGHSREITYQNGQIAKIHAGEAHVAYRYTLGGQLSLVQTPLTEKALSYTKSGLPHKTFIHIRGEGFSEKMSWNSSSKLESYEGFGKERSCFYTPSNNLEQIGDEKYQLDFGGIGPGKVTKTKAYALTPDNTDLFGRPTFYEEEGAVIYDALGQLVQKGEASYGFDPWGRLVSVSSCFLEWRGVYDALGRLLKVKEQEEGRTTTTKFYYDPEGEFKELGVEVDEKAFWKLSGPALVDAVIDDNEQVAYLTYNTLQQLEVITTKEGITTQSSYPEAYGYSSYQAPSPLTLVEYAFSISWRGLRVDSTGLILIGARYYDPKYGTFLTPDPAGPLVCLDLYTYAMSDPINYYDPDGRFASSLYKGGVGAFKLGALAVDVLHRHSPSYHGTRLLSNKVSAWMVDYGFSRSKDLEIPGIKDSNIGINFVPGIRYSLEETKKMGEYIREFSGHLSIQLTHAASYGSILDPIMCLLDKIGWRFPPTILLRRKWIAFFKKNGPDAVYLQICHSRGGLHVKKALLDTPKEIRDRIIVLAIAPAAIIPKELCMDSFNYMSKRDFVTLTDVIGYAKHKDELIILEPHPDAPLVDHSFTSPTFKKAIGEAISDYTGNHLKQGGRE